MATTISPVDRRRELQQAADEYAHDKLTEKQFEERISKYRPSYRTSPPPVETRGSVRHALRHLLGMAE